MNKPEPQTYYNYQEVRQWIKQQHGIDISDYRNRHGKVYDRSVDYLSFRDIIHEHLSDEMHNGVLVTIDHEWEEEEINTSENGDQGRAWVLHCLKLLREEFGTPHPENPNGWFVDIYYWW